MRPDLSGANRGLRKPTGPEHLNVPLSEKIMKGHKMPQTPTFDDPYLGKTRFITGGGGTSSGTFTTTTPANVTWNTITPRWTPSTTYTWDETTFSDSVEIVALREMASALEDAYMNGLLDHIPELKSVMTRYDSTIGGKAIKKRAVGRLLARMVADLERRVAARM